MINEKFFQVLLYKTRSVVAQQQNVKNAISPTY